VINNYKVKNNNISLYLTILFFGLLSGLITLYLFKNQEQWYLVLAFILSFLIIYKPVFGVISIIILSPFGMFVSIERIGTISKYLGLLTLVSFSLRLLIANDIKLKIPKELKWFVLFIILGFTSTFWAYSASAVMSRSFTLFQLIILYIITYNLLINNYKNYKYVYIAILIAGMFISIYSLSILINIGNITNWTRISVSSKIDVNHLASFLLIPFWISFYYFKDKSSIYIIPLLIISIAIIITQSRSALITVIITSILYFLFNKNKKTIKPIIALFVLVASLTLLVPVQFYSRFLTLISDKEFILNVGGGRYYIWSYGWDLFKTSPFYGIGLGNFAWLLRPPHSLFVQIGSELGILGVFVFSIFLYTLLFKPKIKNNMELFIVISILLISLTLDIFYRHYFLLVLCMYSAKRNA